MNKLTKIGVSALCGTLASVAASNAGSLDVSGGATATYSSNEGTVTGNPIGMSSAISFAGSGELDNGSTVSLAIDHDDQNAYSATAISIATPSMGTFAIDSGAGGRGIDRYDDMMPTAWEETTGTSLGTGINTPSGMGGQTAIEWALPADMMPDGITAYAAYSPRANGTKANDKSVGGSASEGVGSGWDIVGSYSGVDGLNVFAGYSQVTSDQDAAVASGDKKERVLGATYSVGSVTVGYQWSKQEYNLAAATSTQHYENDAFGVAFNVNDDLSISYGVMKSDRKLANATSVEAEAQSLQVAYSMGGASIKLAETTGDNLKYTSGSTQDRDATTIALSLAF
jgi:outer membrane protein OmpU